MAVQNQESSRARGRRRKRGRGTARSSLKGGRRAPIMLSPETARGLANGLGWFSIALGVAEIVAPRTLTRALGMRRSERLVQAYGVREVATGVAILASRNPAPWIWGRVGGDALDLATLTAGLDRDNPHRGNAGAGIAAVIGVTALDVVCGLSLSSHRGQQQQRRLAAVRDYRDRSGLPRPSEEMRGAARAFEVPADMRTPGPLRPYAQ